MKERSIVTCVLLSFFTFGIYTLFWMAHIQNDVNELTNDRRTSGGLVVLLSILTFGIYGLFWLYQLGTRVDTLEKNSSNTNGILYLIVGLLGVAIVDLCLAQNSINNTILGINNAKKEEKDRYNYDAEYFK